MVRSHNGENSSLITHLISTYRGMCIQAYNEFINEKELVEFCTLIIGLMHDICKDTQAFQEHLNGTNNEKSTRHSGSSAYIAAVVSKYILDKNVNILKEHRLRNFVPNIIFTVISSHHDKIKSVKLFYDFKDSLNEWKETNSKVSKRIINYILKKYGVSNKFEDIKEQIDDNNDIEIIDKDNKKCLESFVLIRTFLGNLVSADIISAKCQTSNIKDNGYKIFKNYDKGNFSNICVKTDNSNEMNEMRNCFQENAIDNYIQNSNKYLFVLDAKTGMGKTICAFRLLKEINPQKAIVFTPRVNICNQTFNEAIKCIDNNNLLLKTYVDEKLYNSDSDKNENIDLLNEFDCSFIITTYNRFHNLFFDIRRNNCIYHNGLKNALFIFDEFHCFNPKSLPNLMAELDILNYYFGIKVIFMSATPYSNNILNNSFKLFNEKEINIVHLIDDSCKQKINELPERRIYKFIEPKKINEIKDSLSKKRNENKGKSCIVFCNLVNDAKEISKSLNANYCVTANLRPIDIKEQIKKISIDLKHNKKITVVCSPVIQAGVDLDFDMAFVETNSISTIMQEAGRCGRSYNNFRGTCKVYIFGIQHEYKGREYPSWMQQMSFNSNELNKFEKTEKDIIHCSISDLKSKMTKGFLSENELEGIIYKHENKLKENFGIIKSKIRTDSSIFKKICFNNSDISDYFSNTINLTKIIDDSESAGFAVFTGEENDLFEEINNIGEEIKELKKENFFNNYNKIKLKKKEFYNKINSVMIRRKSVIDEVEKNFNSKGSLVKKFDWCNIYYITNAENNCYNKKCGYIGFKATII